MSISTEIETLSQNLQNIKSAIESKGGSAEGGFSEMASAIDNLPEGGGGNIDPTKIQFGRVGYASYSEKVNIQYAQACEVTVKDASLFLAFAREHLGGCSYIQVYAGTSSDVYSFDANDYSTMSQYSYQVAKSQVEQVTGLKIDITSTSTPVSITILTSTEYDTNNLTYEEFVSLAELQTLKGAPNSQGGYPDVEKTFTINGHSVVREAIVDVMLGTEVTSLPYGFCARCTRLVRFDFNNASLTATPDYFLAACSVFNSTVDIPSTVTRIAPGFLMGCRLFNKPVTLPAGVQSIGDNFLYACEAYNQSIVFPSSLQSVGAHCLHSARAFNCDLVLPSTLTVNWEYFLAYCDSMTSTIYVACNLPSSSSSSSSMYCVLASNNNASATYTNGIKIIGPKKAELMAALPNGQTAGSYSWEKGYRKLVDGGE